MHRSIYFRGALGVLAVIGAVLIVIGMWAALMAGRAENPPVFGTDPPVLKFSASEVTSPTRTKVGDEIEISGTLVASATAVVRAKASGILLRLDVNVGGRVDAGQSIGQIDDTEINLRLAERQASVESARVQLRQAKRQHQTDAELAAQKFISGKALATSRSNLETARLQFELAMAQSTTGVVSLRDTKLTAPIRGLVSKRHVLVGEKVVPEQSVVTIVDLSSLVLAGLVGTHQVTRLSPGMPLDVHVEGSAAPMVGRIERVAPAAEPGTRSVAVTISIPNTGETLRAGQYGVARLSLADEAECLTLPLEAVVRNAGQDYVWMIENGTLFHRAVTVGRRDAVRGCIEAPSSVTEKSVVLTTRFDSLREGASAAVVAPASASRLGATP